MHDANCRTYWYTIHRPKLRIFPNSVSFITRYLTKEKTIRQNLNMLTYINIPTDDFDCGHFVEP